MKRGTLIKDLFENKKYVDVIEALQNICSGLFEDMLDRKDVSENYKEMPYENQKILVKKYYPNFKKNIIILDNVSSIETYTYLDIINSYLSTYEYLKNNYQKY
jgi:uncharacterized protein (DUF1919 family)